MLLLKFFCICGIIFLICYYEENPPVMITIAAILSFLLLMSGEETIIVYSDRIVQTTNSIYSLISKSEALVYYIDEIKLAYVESKRKTSITEVAAASLITLIIPSRVRRIDKTIPIYLTMKHGEIIEIYSDLPEKSLKKIVTLVNSMIK